MRCLQFSAHVAVNSAHVLLLKLKIEHNVMHNIVALRDRIVS